MKRSRFSRRFSACIGLLAALPSLASEVLVEALLPGLAVMQIDGRRVRLRAGESHGPVTLIEATSTSALISIGGKPQRLEVSQRISARFTQPQERRVSIQRDRQLQYLTSAEINGVRLPVVVDTGANIVVLNSRQAARIGVDAEAGTPSRVQTAGAVINARQVVLDSVSVGGIRVDTVAAAVIDGEFPATALLGMSYLKHVELSDEGGIMTLRARW